MASPMLRVPDAALAASTSTPLRCVGAVLRERVVLSQCAGGCSADGTLFAVASLSKLVTAVVALQCAERGELSLDEDVNTKLPPGCRAANPGHPGARLTARMLLQHRSGLQDDESALHVGPWRTAGGDCAASLEEYIAARFAGPDSHALWQPEPPGAAAYHYSNLGITLLALFIQTAVGGGATVATLARERVFAPLGMTRTAFLVSDAHAILAADSGAELASPHDSHGVRFEPYGVAEWPAAGLRTTLADVLRFAAQFTAPPGDCALLRATSLAEMLPASGEGGLAWWGRDATYGEKGRVGTVWAHGGFMEGVRAHLYLFQRQRLAIALAQNGEDDYEALTHAAERAIADAAEALDPDGELALRDIVERL
jgi:CubicO group peptidase (beta-lactamase class C family)